MLRRDLLASGMATIPLSLLPGAVLAQGTAPVPADTIVEKKVFELPSYTTRGGATIANVRVGYQTMGRLNAEGTNAILVCHFFSGDSHAFGRYDAAGPAGYWDAIIGPGKAIDTQQYCAISVDCLVNVNVPNARTVTTGPASLNPSTGRPYGMEFPVIAMRDFVEVQKKLLDSLGVKRLHMVTGPSNGALQAVEWAAAYPAFIERCMPVIGGSEFDAWMIGWLNIWQAPIKLDANWRNGDYYAMGREAPLRGLAEAWKLVTLHARDRASLGAYGRKVVEGQNPARTIGDQFAVEKWLDDAAMARARTSDANSFIYMVRANQLFLHEYASYEAALANAPKRWLVIPSPTDRVFLPEAMHDMVEALKRAGKTVQQAEVRGPLGHLNGVVGMAPLAEQIRSFVNS